MSKNYFVRQFAAFPIWAAFLLIFLAPSSYVGCCSATNVAGDPLAKLLREHEISIRLDGTSFAARDFSLAKLHKTWESHHDHLSHNADLQFDFSVRCLDWERILAFLNALPTLPSEQLALLEGKTIYLNGADMQLCTASPYQPKDFSEAMKLVVAQAGAQANLLTDLKVICPFDTAKALANFERANAEMENYSAEILQAEKSLETLPQDEKSTQLEKLGTQKRQRFNAAHICRINAMALLHMQPDNDRYQTMMGKAQSAIDSFAVSVDYLSNQN